MLSAVICFVVTISALITVTEVFDKFEHAKNLDVSQRAHEFLTERILAAVRTDRIGEVIASISDTVEDLTPDNFKNMVEPVKNQTTYFTAYYLLDEDRVEYEKHLSQLYNETVQITDFGTQTVSSRRAEYWAGYLNGGTNAVKSFDHLSDPFFAEILDRVRETGEVGYSVPIVETTTTGEGQLYFIELFPVFEIDGWRGQGLLGGFTTFTTLFAAEIQPESFISSGDSRYFTVHMAQNGVEYLAYEYGDAKGTTSEHVFTFVDDIDGATTITVMGYEIVTGLDSDVKLGLLFGCVVVSVALSLWEYLRVALVKKTTVAMDKAKCASVEKSRFLSNMSHEIRTPLNGIIGMTDVMDKNALDPDSRYCVDIIRSCGSSLLSLVNNILDISAIEAGRIDLNYEWLEIKPLLLDTVSDSWTTMSTRLSTLIEKTTVVIHDGVPDTTVRSDPVRIQQVLTNLLTNAFKYTKKGSVTVEASCTNCPKPGFVVIKLMVIDTGVGMTPENLKDLFKAFTRFAGDKQIEGTGIGLSIAKGISEKLGGDISCESEEGVGTKFVFTFVAEGVVNPSGECGGAPFRKEYTKNEASMVCSNDDRKRQETEEVEYIINPRAKILVVDDIRINRTIIQRLLAKYGCIADMAEDGKQAVDMCMKSKYDVILIDNVMPRMGGMEATSIIRAKEGPSQAAVIVVVSADVLRTSVDAYLKSGADGFIPKPFRQKDLFEKLVALTPLVTEMVNVDEHEAAIRARAASVPCWSKSTRDAGGI